VAVAAPRLCPSLESGSSLSQRWKNVTQTNSSAAFKIQGDLQEVEIAPGDLGVARNIRKRILVGNFAFQKPPPIRPSCLATRWHK